MKIVVTGAIGYIGAAVVEAPMKAGHEVAQIVRTREKESAVRAPAGMPLPGNLAEPRTYLNAAAAHDACIHLGFDAGREAVATDRTAIATFLDALTRRGNVPAVVVYRSGVLVLGDTGDTPADESASTAHALPMVAWWPPHDQLALAATTASRATRVVRARFTYGGGQGLIGGDFESAGREGAAVYVGDDANRIALVHRDERAAVRPTSGWTPHHRPFVQSVHQASDEWRAARPSGE